MNRQLKVGIRRIDRPGQVENPGSPSPPAVNGSDLGRRPHPNSLDRCPRSRALHQSGGPRILQGAGLMSGASLFRFFHSTPAVQKRLRAEFRTNGETPSPQPRSNVSRTEGSPGASRADHESARPSCRTSYRVSYLSVSMVPIAREARGRRQYRTGASRHHRREPSARPTGSGGKNGKSRRVNGWNRPRTQQPLFGIIGLGEVIQDEQDLEHIKSCAQDIVAHGRRMATIIRDFTGVTNREASTSTCRYPWSRYWTKCWPRHRPPLTWKSIVIHKTYAGHTPVSVFPDQLRQALVNLVTNAAQAMKGSGTLTLTTAVSDQTATATIADSGSGISKLHLSKVFDPFFTTKGQGEGSGLGLTVADGLSESSEAISASKASKVKGPPAFVTLPISAATDPEGGPWTPSASRSEPQPSHSS